MSFPPAAMNVFVFLSVIPEGNLFSLRQKPSNAQEQKQIPCGNDRKKSNCRAQGWETTTVGRASLPR
jgi:hypothetical protein